MNRYVLGFQDIDRRKFTVAGGKGANLGELYKVKGVKVPEGFCVTTRAYKKITGNNQELSSLLDELACCKAGEREKISEISARIRAVIEQTSIPDDIVEEVAYYLTSFGENDAFAVRSSATAEDLPGASFAGQQDTYLNIIGKEAILQHISRCWASLFTDRAVIYRIQNGFDHRKVYLAVVVQKMIFPQAAGILFTADAVTSNRKVLSIDASFGLGEAVVSGLVNADVYKVRDGKVVDKKVPAKKLAVYTLKDGGTEKQEIDPARQNRQVLTDEQVLRLAHIGRKIEEYFGQPQDIEWCLMDDVFYIVQSRPITTLYPIPEANDKGNHVYVSVGHQQMMTAPMRPLGITLWQMTALAQMFKAGGRLFVDVSKNLATPAGRDALLDVMGKHDPLMKDAIMAIIERGDFIEEQNPNEPGKTVSPLRSPAPIENDPAIVSELIHRSQASIEELKQKIQTRSGTELFELILEDIQELKKITFDPRSFDVFMTAINASSWINEKMEEWLGEKNAADILSQSVPNNITSEMGLELLDVADAIRPHPEVINYLQHAKDEDFFDGLVTLDGGREA
ncbi:MAG TPA: phosphoenolpyruvate synthase, partial [Puia sp.]